MDLYDRFLDYVVPITFVILYLAAMCAAIYYMLVRHPEEIYVIWLVSAFFFTVFLGVSYFSAKHNIPPPEVCGSYKERCSQILDMLLNIEDEVKLVGAFVAVTVVPQVLAYLLSALTGTAVAPSYVWTIQQAAAWSLIKFVAGLAGMMSSLPFGAYFAGKPFTAVPLLMGSFLIAMTFVLAFLHHAFSDGWTYLSRKFSDDQEPRNFLIRALIAIHVWSTRNVPKKRPHSLTRRALIELLKSDAVYDYMAQDIQNAIPFRQREPSKAND